MKKYKLIALDLDGTLLDNSKRIKEETKKNIIDAYNLGVKICISTGRGYPAVIRYINELDIPTHKILFNGSIVYDLDNVISNSIIDPITAKVVFDTITICGGTCCFWVGEKLYFNKNDKYLEYYESLSSIKANVVSTYDDALFSSVNKFIWFSEEKRHSEIKNDILSKIEGIDYFTSQKVIIEIVPKGVNKGSALQKLADYLNIDLEEVIAIGDDENDISMIQMAGLGVAMANAKEIVKHNSDYITTTNEENGVGEVIKKFIL